MKSHPLRGAAARPTSLLLALLVALCGTRAAAAHRRGLSAAAAAPTKLRLLHINDVHNRIEQTGPSSTACTPAQAAGGVCLGGWPRLVSYTKAARAKAAAAGDAFLLVDAGDEFDGTLWDVVYKGQASAVMQNIAKVDVMTLGNHEFTYKPPILNAYLEAIEFPMLGACNTDVTFEPQIKDELIKRWHIHQLGRYKVATLGWLTPDTAFTAANVGKVRVNPVVPAVKKCVADLKAEHPDVHMIIGLSHTGYNPDLVTAKAVPELDLIVGGHSHTFLKTPVGVGPIFDLSGGATAANCADERACDVSSGPYPTYVKTKLCTGEGAAKNCTNKAVPVVQAFYASKYIGDLVIDLASKRITSAKPVLLGGANSSNPVPQDPATLAAIERLAPPVQDLETESAGLVNVLMIGGRPGRVQETNFGSYLADIMIRAVKLNPKFEAKNGPLNIAVTNSGSIRADIDPGEVTYGDVLTALPFRNTLAVKALTGEQLIGVFKHSVSLISEGEGLFLQVSGVRVFHRGDDLVAVKLLAPNGTTSDIDPAASYNVATIDFVANGGDGYESFKNAPSLLALGNEIGDIMFADLENNMPNAIKVPDVTKTRRIINCEATYVKCGNPVFGPCCAAGAAAPKAAAPKAAAPKGAAPKAAAKPPKTAP